jgi:hypothetical protein
MGIGATPENIPVNNHKVTALLRDRHVIGGARCFRIRNPKSARPASHVMTNLLLVYQLISGCRRMESEHHARLNPRNAPTKSAYAWRWAVARRHHETILVEAIIIHLVGGIARILVGHGYL